MNKTSDFANGVYPDSGRAFIDRAEISIYEPLVARPWPRITEVQNKSAFGPRSFYGRYASGIFEPTGNPIQLHYTKMTAFPCVPQAQLRLDSERTPLTIGEMELALRCLTGDPAFGRMAYVEIACDFYEPYDELDRQLVSASTHRRMRFRNREDGRRSHYFGGRKSERYVILYEKPPVVPRSVTRVKIRLSQRALRRLGLVHPDQLLLLRNIDFTPLVAFCELRLPASVVQERYRRDSCFYCAKHAGVDSVVRDLTTFYPVARSTVLRPTPLDAKIREMWSNLVC